MEPARLLFALGDRRAARVSHRAPPELAFGRNYSELRIGFTFRAHHTGFNFMEPDRRMRVFVVDDNELARHLIKDLVCRNGWEVCAEASNGQEAVEMVREVRPDVIILDFMMPVKDGLQAAREILQLRPSVPIVLHTLFTTDQLRTLAEGIGVRHVVSKFNSRSLSETLTSLAEPPVSLGYANRF
jgi:two-component system, chemotaxis family, chemotaxis protein CheY